MKWFNKTWDIRPNIEVYNKSLLLSSLNLFIKEMREISNFKNEIHDKINGNYANIEYIIISNFFQSIAKTIIKSKW